MQQAPSLRPMVEGDHKLRRHLAENLRRYRALRGISQDALAHEANLHRTFVGMVERAERNVSLDNIEKLATALNLEGYELLRPRD